jgi:microcin C transport system permease protein
MSAYILRRILFMIPTLLGIMFVSFVVVQFAPGGPVERVIAQLTGSDTGATSRISGSAGGDFGARGQLQGASQLDAANSKYRGAQGLDPEFMNASASCCGTTRASISARATSATSACCS